MYSLSQKNNQKYLHLVGCNYKIKKAETGKTDSWNKIYNVASTAVYYQIYVAHVLFLL